MNKIIATLLFAAIVATPAFSDDLNSFEKSLLTKPDSASADNSSQEEFEKSLIADQQSEMGPVYKLRENLLESVNEGDTARIAALIAEIESQKTRKIMPIQEVEKGYLYVENKMFNRLREHIVHFYKTSYDTLEMDEGFKEAKGDGLELHVMDGLKKRDRNQNLYYSLAADIEKANMSAADKEELALLLLLSDAYKDKESRTDIQTRAAKFVEAHPDHPDAEWIKKSVLFPLEHMDVRKMYSEQRGAMKEKTISDKLYTGGFGLNVFLFDGGFSSIDPDYNDELVRPQGPLHFELYFQIMRFAFFFENRPTGAEGITSADIGFGYVVFDSRYLKVRPYLAFSSPATSLRVRKEFDLVDGDPDDPDADVTHYTGGDEIDEMSDNSVGYTLGVNVDFKFLTTFLFTSDSKLSSFSLVGQFGISYLDVDDVFNKDSGVAGFFGIGLGIYFW